MARIILTLIVLAAFLFALKVPQGYFKPNWKAAYAKADAADDCKAMKRILAGVHFSGSYEWVGKKVELESAERCGYEKNPEAVKEYEKRRKYFEDGEKGGPGDSSYYAKIKLLNHYVWRRRKDTQFRLTNEITHFVFACQTAGAPGLKLALDFAPLRYALKHRHLSEDDIERFANAKDNYCASLAMRLAQRIEALHPDEKYNRTAEYFWWGAAVISPASPSLQYQSTMHQREFRDWWKVEYEKAKAEGREEEFQRGKGRGLVFDLEKLNILKMDYEFDHYAGTCDGDARPIAHPVLSLECADLMLKQRAGFDPGTKSFHAAFAEYHIRRAERLGALDITALRQRLGGLTPACMKAVINAEEQDFAAISDIQTQRPYFLAEDAMARMEAECREVSEHYASAPSASSASLEAGGRQYIEEASRELVAAFENICVQTNVERDDIYMKAAELGWEPAGPFELALAKGVTRSSSPAYYLAKEGWLPFILEFEDKLAEAPGYLLCSIRMSGISSETEIAREETEIFRQQLAQQYRLEDVLEPPRETSEPDGTSFPQYAFGFSAMEPGDGPTLGYQWVRGSHALIALRMDEAD